MDSPFAGKMGLTMYFIGSPFRTGRSDWRWIQGREPVLLPVLSMVPGPQGIRGLARRRAVPRCGAGDETLGADCLAFAEAIPADAASGWPGSSPGRGG